MYGKIKNTGWNGILENENIFHRHDPKPKKSVRDRCHTLRRAWKFKEHRLIMKTELAEVA